VRPVRSYDPSRPLYFHHIPKTAGSSMTALLREAFGERLCPAQHWDSLAALPGEELDAYRAYTGHFAAYLARYLGREVNAFTILRDPVERTVSHYAHILRDGAHPFHAATANLSLLEFVTHPAMSHNVRNYQARYLADLGLDPRKIARAHEKPDVVNYPMQMFIDDHSLTTPAHVLRARSLEALERFFLVGVVDAFDAAVAAFSRMTGIPLGETTRINAAPEPFKTRAIDAETLAAIREATEIDQELYELARNRWPARRV
jgi:hypothetical protein